MEAKSQKRQKWLDEKKRWTPDVVRQRIRVGMIVRKLMQHVVGKADMTATQIRAAEILLRKTVPDLNATAIDTTVTHYVATLTDAQLEAIAAGGSAGAAETPGRKTDPTRLQ